MFNVFEGKLERKFNYYTGLLNFSRKNLDNLNLIYNKFKTINPTLKLQ